MLFHPFVVILTLALSSTSDAKLTLSRDDQLSASTHVLKNCIKAILNKHLGRKSLIFMQRELKESAVARAVLKETFLPKIVTDQPKIVKRRRFYLLFTKHNNHHLMDIDFNPWLMSEKVQHKVSTSLFSVRGGKKFLGNF